MKKYESGIFLTAQEMQLLIDFRKMPTDAGITLCKVAQSYAAKKMLPAVVQPIKLRLVGNDITADIYAG